jgi:hypothetical protein
MRQKKKLGEVTVSTIDNRLGERLIGIDYESQVIVHTEYYCLQ